MRRQTDDERSVSHRVIAWRALARSLLRRPFARRASAQSVEEFYKGRPINMMIGGGAGGGYDVYFRALGRHSASTFPAIPNIIPKNQPAASGLAAAAALYTTADKDGAHHRGLPQQRADGPAVRQSGARATTRSSSTGSARIGKLQNVCATWHTSPIKTIAAGAASARSIVAAAAAPTNTRDHAARAQCAARHEIQADHRLRSRRRPDAWRSSAARPRASAACHGRP